MKIHTGSESHVQEKVYNRMTEIGRQSVRKEGEIIPEQSTYSFADFLRKVVSAFARKGSKVECVQTANGFEFANRFSPSKREIKTFFEQTAFDLGIRSKRLHSYTPRRNGKAAHSHREDQKRFYDSHRFYSLTDFGGKLSSHAPLLLALFSSVSVPVQSVWQTFIFLF